MALSRIWSAFIIIAILVGSYKLLVRSDDKSIFSTMVTGRSGDTIKIRTKDTALIRKDILRNLDTNKVFVSAEEKMVKTGDGKLLVFKMQTSDGVIETSLESYKMVFTCNIGITCLLAAKIILTSIRIAITGVVSIKMIGHPGCV